MFELIRANQRRTALLVAAMAGLLLASGFAVGVILSPDATAGGAAGLVAGGVLWGLMAMISYSSGGAMFLALAGARKIQKENHPVLFNVVEEMCVAAGLPKPPGVYVIDEAAPNAFATGRGPDQSSVAVTAGLLERLDRDELQGVIGHELSHVKNRDVLYLLMLGAMMGAIVVLADAGRRIQWWGGGVRRRTSDKGGSGQAIVVLVAILLVILAPLIAQLLYLAVSRRREYLADACSAQLTRYPEGLASALEKIAGSGIAMREAPRAMAPMYIAAPTGALGSTHPPIEERIRILRTMARSGGLAEYDEAFRKVTRRPVGLLPPGALADRPAGSLPETPVPSRAPRAPDAARDEALAQIGRVRQTTDMLWRMKHYAFLPCACGTTLKVPPVYAGETLSCPHCSAPLSVPAHT